MKIKLTKPIMSFGEEIDEIELREDLTAGDLKVLDRATGDIAKAFELLSHLSGIPVSYLEKLSISDFQNINTEGIEKLLGK
jgi:hypothetical protein